MTKKQSSKGSFLIFIAFLLFACLIFSFQIFKNINKNFDITDIYDSREKIEVNLIYAAESELYLKDAIEEFNQSYKKGINPITQEKLKDGDKIIQINAEIGSSGGTRTKIVNAINKINTTNTAKPTIFAPSVRHWLQLVNLETNKEIFREENTYDTAMAPVVMAIWESRLNMLKSKHPNEDIGWKHLLEVLNSPNGWEDYTEETNIRKKVYYGHTDPNHSSTALSTLIAEYYASAKYLENNQNLEQLTKTQVQNKEVQEHVQKIEELIKHYSSTTTDFKEYIAQGPNYLDFVALEENDLVYINQGKTEYQPPEKLVALYPAEGTFIHEHPMGILDAEWVSEEQKEAAKNFVNYILSEKIQEKVLEAGFRPVNENIELKYPISKDNGVDPNQPKNILKVPTPETILAAQETWHYVKKKSKIFILIDNSGSMEGTKITNAKQAIEKFANDMPQQNYIGLYSFSDNLEERVPITTLETNKNQILNGISEIYADAGTALYDSLLETINKLSEETDTETIKAIVLLSDGEDTASSNSLNTVTSKLEELQKSDNPILIIPIAYGEEGSNNIEALARIARASSTKLQTGDVEDIETLFENISSYF